MLSSFRAFDHTARISLLIIDNMNTRHIDVMLGRGTSSIAAGANGIGSSDETLTPDTESKYQAQITSQTFAYPKPSGTQ